MNITTIHMHLKGSEKVKADLRTLDDETYIALRIDDAAIFINDRQQAMAIASAIESASMQWPEEVAEVTESA